MTVQKKGTTMTYQVEVDGLQVYDGDDPVCAMDLAKMLRSEEPKEVHIIIRLVKEVLP